jgi:L-ascorbate metabolism protein UlaG (beta-lactamase superfamily)
MEMSEEVLDQLRWLGHDSFVLEGSMTVYFDPWRLSGDLPTADLILVSHEHGDHCSPDDVAKISGPNTVIVASVGSAAKLVGDVRVLGAGESITVGAVKVDAVPAYNVDKFRAPGVPFHPKASAHNGYVVSAPVGRIYFAGDTDHISEMADVACDVALLPVSGTYVMTAEEAAEAAQTIDPGVAVPMHYGAGVVGSVDDAERFAALYAGQVYIFGRGK